MTDNRTNEKIVHDLLWGRKLIEPGMGVILANDAHAIAKDVVAALEAATRVPVQGEPNDGPDFAGLIQAIKQTGGSVEVAGVKIMPCDEYGRTAAVPDAATEKLREASEADRIRLGHLQDEVYRLEAERDAALAAVAAVRAIHKVKHGEMPRYAADDYHAEREPVSWEKYSMCEGCSATWPCQTVAALDGAPEPEWEYGCDTGLGDEPREHASLDAATWDASGVSTRTSAEGQVTEFQRYVVRRRKAGPWLPVEGESK